ncbi:MAG: hypothetical protein HDQ91_06165 [Desulfovibrio sp.]|nr:hypothetical protein [Desulfovibrio sp.]
MDDNTSKNKRQVLDAEIVGQEKQRDWQRERYAGQQGFSGVWTFSPMERSGCLGPAVTFALFLICIGQFGILAGIGFAVFYTIGSILGSVHFTRLLMEGRPSNPWAWRVGNWTISLLVTIWLAGGFQD